MTPNNINISDQDAKLCLSVSVSVSKLATQIRALSRRQEETLLEPTGSKMADNDTQNKQTVESIFY